MLPNSNIFVKETWYQSHFEEDVGLFGEYFVELLDSTRVSVLAYPLSPFMEAYGLDWEKPPLWLLDKKGFRQLRLCTAVIEIRCSVNQLASFFFVFNFWTRAYHMWAKLCMNRIMHMYIQVICIWSTFSVQYVHIFILLGKLAGKHEYVCNVHLSKMSPFWLKWNCDHHDQKKTVPLAFYLSSLFEPCLDSLQSSSQRLPPRKAAGFQPMMRRMQMPCNGLRLLLALPRRRRLILPTLVPSL